nr:MAG TPA: lytic transglycosylase [Caudoviricetes sp.]
MIADVVINRMRHPRFPDTACKVVYQRHQFSWTAKNPVVNERDAWANSRKLAIKKYRQYLTQTRVDKSRNSVFFTQGKRFGRVVTRCSKHIFMEL